MVTPTSIRQRAFVGQTYILANLPGNPIPCVGIGTVTSVSLRSRMIEKT